MAALEETAVTHNTAGRFKEKKVTFSSVSDADTYDVGRVGLQRVERAQVYMTGTAPVAADSLVVASISGRTITFQQAGTPRPAEMVVVGT
jgi:hypothetical protein